MWIEQTVVVMYYVGKVHLESVTEPQTAFAAFATSEIVLTTSMDHYYCLYQNRKNIRRSHKQLKFLISNCVHHDITYAN